METINAKVSLIESGGDWDSDVYALKFDKGINSWQRGRPHSSFASIEKARNDLMKNSPDKVDVLFATIEGKEESSKKVMTKRLLALIDGTDYHIDGNWQNRVVKGNTLPTQFVISISK
jgi:hypothetical protein